MVRTTGLRRAFFRSRDKDGSSIKSWERRLFLGSCPPLPETSIGADRLDRILGRGKAPQRSRLFMTISRKWSKVPREATKAAT